jgi:acetyl-CoA decarbonylase/synthase complex subunit delta
LNDPIEQAKAIEEKKMADLIAFHMISIDVENKDPSEAVKTLKRLLDEVGMPIVVGGCGDVKKDVALFKEVVKVCKDEGVVLNSATLESADEIGKLAKESGSAVISWVQLDINQQKQLNKSIAKYTREIIMDTTTAGFGYGTEYSFTTMERIRLAGLKGDEDLAYPIMTAGSNAWGCREAWMKDTILDETTWGDRMLRGPIWEIGTSLVSILAGADLVLNLHPKSAECLQKLREEFKVVV